MDFPLLQPRSFSHAKSEKEKSKGEKEAAFEEKEEDLPSVLSLLLALPLATSHNLFYSIAWEDQAIVRKILFCVRSLLYFLSTRWPHQEKE